MASDNTAQNRIAQLERELDQAKKANARLQQRLAEVQPLLQRAKDLAFWDFSVYDVKPDSSWLAVDRVEASLLLSALAEVDHWQPWSTRIEPRPQA